MITKPLKAVSYFESSKSLEFSVDKKAIKKKYFLNAEKILKLRLSRESDTGSFLYFLIKICP